MFLSLVFSFYLNLLLLATTKDFNIIYYTNDAEDSASHEDGNAGFCLVFEQILA
jgi:hypothetical protein